MDNLFFKNHELKFLFKIDLLNKNPLYIYRCLTCNALFHVRCFDDKAFPERVFFPYIFDSCGNGNLFSFAYNTIKKLNVARDFKAGLYSGFPLCCNLFFSTSFGFLISRHIWFWIMQIFDHDEISLGAEYIKCPFCLLFGRQSIGRIDEERGLCKKTRWFESFIVFIKWKLTSKKSKIKYNMMVRKNDFKRTMFE